jgi:hypothetical protein
MEVTVSFVIYRQVFQPLRKFAARNGYIQARYILLVKNRYLIFLLRE